MDHVVPVNRVEVKTVTGVVTLSGTVDNILIKDRALHLARTVRGVKSVINTIRVRPLDRADAEIEKDVRKALQGNPVLKAHDLYIGVRDAVVAISGDVAPCRRSG